jgi:hypothetical protein
VSYPSIPPENKNRANTACRIVGQLKQTIPSFVTVEHDEASRKATLSVQDSMIPHQRAMWGAFLSIEVKGKFI